MSEPASGDSGEPATPPAEPETQTQDILKQVLDSINTQATIGFDLGEGATDEIKAKVTEFQNKQTEANARTLAYLKQIQLDRLKAANPAIYEDYKDRSIEEISTAIDVASKLSPSPTSETPPSNPPPSRNQGVPNAPPAAHTHIASHTDLRTGKKHCATCGQLYE